MHDHQFEHQWQGDGKGSKNLLMAFFLNISFAIIEIIGAYFTNSAAIFSDALHDFGDSLALLFSYFSEKYSQKDPDETYTFGYRRFSVLSALVNTIILTVGSVFIIIEGISRIKDPQVVQPEGMLVLAILGIIVNSIAVLRLKNEHSLNSQMVMYHLLEDVLGWIAILIVSIILFFKPWYFLDAVLSLLIAMVILRGVFKGFKKIMSVFLNRFPDDLAIEEIKKEIVSLELVQNVHAVKGWSIDSDHHYLRFHLQVPAETKIKDVDELRKTIKEMLLKHKVMISTIEFESAAISPDRCD